MRKTFYFAVFLVFVLTPSVCFACKCAQEPSLKEAVNDASIAFTGRVTSLVESPLRKGFYEVEFSVFNKYKNDYPDIPNEKVIIYTAIAKEGCGYDFLLEQDYLVFAKGTPAFYQASSCSRTRVVDLATADIQNLNKLVRKR